MYAIDTSAHCVPWGIMGACLVRAFRGTELVDVGGDVAVDELLREEAGDGDHRQAAVLELLRLKTACAPLGAAVASGKTCAHSAAAQRTGSEIVCSTDFCTLCPGRGAHHMYQARPFVRGGKGETALYARWLAVEARDCEPRGA